MVSKTLGIGRGELWRGYFRHGRDHSPGSSMTTSSKRKSYIGAGKGSHTAINKRTGRATGSDGLRDGLC